jgi:hypothetical protein
MTTAIGEKIRRRKPRRIIVVSRCVKRLYAFIAAFTASAVIGSERIRAPQALKIALPSADRTR